MEEKLLSEAIALFNNNEKWLSFIELSNNKEKIKEIWFQKLKNCFFNKFNIENPNNKWFLRINGNLLKWTLEKENIWLELNNYERLVLVVNIDKTNKEEVDKKLKEETYSKILTIFDKIDDYYPENNKWWLYSENLDYGFDPEINFYSQDSIAWYAGNEPEKIVDVIYERISRITNNAELSNLFIELNNLTKNELS